jgi:hypothetical protein
VAPLVRPSARGSGERLVGLGGDLRNLITATAIDAFAQPAVLGALRAGLGAISVL